MKKLIIFVLTLFLLLLAGYANAGTPPVIQAFHGVFGNGYFTAFAKIYDANNDLRTFEISALYGVKFTGEKIQIGKGYGYTYGTALQYQDNKQYTFNVMYPSTKITDQFIYIIIMG